MTEKMRFSPATWTLLSGALLCGACQMEESLPPTDDAASHVTAIRQLPGLDSVTFFETTGGPTAKTFAVNGPQLTARRSGALSATNRDFYGVSSGEYYDVFYSDADGNFDIDGPYITVEAVWNRAAPAGGGLNLAAARLDFAGGASDFADHVTSFVALGDNAVPANVDRAVDGDLGTSTSMGNTIGQARRLRVTVGFDLAAGACDPQGDSGDWHYCSAECPCDQGEGDCDGDDECATGLRCAKNVGTDFGWDEDVDVCTSECSRLGRDNGDWHLCSEACPCDDGEGDCDGDDECATGLRCAKNVGADFGWDEDVDVCLEECSRQGMDNGDWHYCSAGCPCDQGEGDCDSDDECLPGLTCVKGDIGLDFGWDEDVDVCMDLFCETEAQWSVSQGGVSLGTISPVGANKSATDFYAYAQVDRASYNAHHFDPTAPRPVSEGSMMFLYRDEGTGDLSLFLVHDKAKDPSGGRAQMQVSGLAADAHIAVSDHPSETSVANGTVSGSWAWAPCCTDGAAISASTWDGCVTIEPSFERGIDQWEALTGACGSNIQLARDEPVQLCPM